MTASDLKLYHSAASPNSRRVRISIAEKGLTVPESAELPCWFESGCQHYKSNTYRMAADREGTFNKAVRDTPGTQNAAPAVAAHALAPTG